MTVDTLVQLSQAKQSIFISSGLKLLKDKSLEETNV